MEKSELLAKVKMGRYTHLKWKRMLEVNGQLVEKTSDGIVRFLGKKDNLVKTSKDGNEYVYIFLTKNHKHKTRSKAVVVETGEIVNPDLGENIKVCFCKRLSDIVEII